MSISAKRKLVVAATGLAVLAGTGGAYAAGQTTPALKVKQAGGAAEQKAFLDDVAKRLNVPREQLDAAIKGAAEARIDAMVAAGKLTKEQGDAAKKRLASGGPLLGGPGLFGGGPGARPVPGGPPRGFGGPGGPGRGHGPMMFGAEGAAAYLGLTKEKLHEQLRSGKSLADVAKAQGKSVDGLKAALKADATKRLDAAVAAGKLTAAQKTKMLAAIDARLDDVINLVPPKLGERPRRRP